jgi:hypothetical protein
MFIYEIYSNLKIVHILNLFIYEKSSYMKIVHISNFENVYISNFENCSYFEKKII